MLVAVRGRRSARRLRTWGIPTFFGLLCGVLELAPADPAGAAPSSESRFEAIAPQRIVDTRAGGAAVVPAGSTIGVPISGRVPANATAVVLNLTVTEPQANGFVTAYSGSVRPNTSNANTDQVGETAANLVVVPLTVPGDARVFTSASAHLVVDLLGWFEPAAGGSQGRYRSVAPAGARVLDTRAEGASIDLAQPRAVAVQGRNGVPATGVRAVALNVTVTETTRPGWLQVIPTGGTTVPGGSSNVNVSNAGQTVANLVLAPLGADGSVTLAGTLAGHVVIDVAGWFTDATAANGTDGLFVAVDPVRLADTRLTGAVGAGATLPVSAAVAGVDPARIGSVLTNLTITEASAPGFVTGYSGVGALPVVSSINADRAGATVANAALIGTSGTSFGLYASVSKHLVVDLLGWFTAAAGGPAPAGAGSIVSTEAGVGGTRMRYRSIGVRNDLQEQLAMIYLPAGSPPPGGWPIMALAHGPLGLADQCANSAQPTQPAEIAPWIAAGYAVVYADLEGLGTPGLHPYLNGPGTGRSILDAVRAARTHLGATLSNKVGSWGFSSGGHGALWVAEMAPTYAPELDFRGAISLDPIAILSWVMGGPPDGFTPWMIQGAVLANPALQYSDVLTPEAIALLPTLNAVCQTAAYPLAESLPNFGRHTNPMTLPAWATTIEQSDPAKRRTAPILIGGGTDHTAPIPAIFHDLHREFSRRACAQGTSVRFQIFPGDHMAMISPAVTNTVVAWLNGQMNGPAQTGCSEVGP